jgi:hypothetical protein
VTTINVATIASAAASAPPAIMSPLRALLPIGQALPMIACTQTRRADGEKIKLSGTDSTLTALNITTSILHTLPD